MRVPKKKSSWPKQAAIVVSQSPNMHMLLRELLRSYSWNVVDSTPRVEHAIAAANEGMVFLIILDDSQDLPVAASLRHLVTDPVCCLMPVLAFFSETSRHDLSAFANLGQPEKVEKPLTPSKFLPGFVNLVKRWEAQPFVTLRKASYALMGDSEAVGVQVLEKLRLIDDLRCPASQALSLKYRQAGRLKDAENILLEALKRSPRDLSTMLALGDFYMHAAMPKLAHRYFSGIRNAFAQSPSILPDLVQASLAMGNMEEAITCLSQMVRDGFMGDVSVQYLARLLFSEGREAEAEKILNNNKIALERLRKAWHSAENQPLPAAG